MIATVCAKVFAIDMSGLTGPWRVLSFLGLGLALIAGVYRRGVLPATRRNTKRDHTLAKRLGGASVQWPIQALCIRHCLSARDAVTAHTGGVEVEMKTCVETRPMLLAAMALGIAAMMVGGCSASSPGTQAATKRQTPDATIAPRDTVAPGALRPDGTLGNGLLPEAWGETS